MARTVMGKGGFRVEVTGFRELYNALDEVDKKATRRIVREITKAGKAVASDAAGRTPTDYPLSNWGAWGTTNRAGAQRDLGFNPAAVASGFRVRRNSFRRRGVSAGIGWDVIQSNAGGSIFEVVGDGSRVTTRSGANLVKVINERFGTRRPRSLFPAYYAQMSGVRERIRDMIIADARKAGLR